MTGGVVMVCALATGAERGAPLVESVATRCAGATLAANRTSTVAEETTRGIDPITDTRTERIPNEKEKFTLEKFTLRF